MVTAGLHSLFKHSRTRLRYVCAKEAQQNSAECQVASQELPGLTCKQHALVLPMYPVEIVPRPMTASAERGQRGGGLVPTWAARAEVHGPHIEFILMFRRNFHHSRSGQCWRLSGEPFCELVFCCCYLVPCAQVRCPSVLRFARRRASKCSCFGVADWALLLNAWCRPDLTAFSRGFAGGASRVPCGPRLLSGRARDM